MFNLVTQKMKYSRLNGVAIADFIAGVTISLRLAIFWLPSCPRSSQFISSNIIYAAMILCGNPLEYWYLIVSDKK